MNLITMTTNVDSNESLFSPVHFLFSARLPSVVALLVQEKVIVVEIVRLFFRIDLKVVF